jgi:lipopolysaccharide export system protein LptC
MKSRFKWVLVIVVVAAICVFGWTASGQKQSNISIQWEYTYTREADIQVFNDLGAQGWELVNVTYGGWSYFKRPKK